MDELFPRFSWRIESSLQNVKQSAYEINVDGMWQSGIVKSGENIHIQYGGKPLLPFTRYDYSIRIWDCDGNESEWSRAFFETGIQVPENFSADWITTSEGNTQVCPVFRKSFKCELPVKSARIYATALGVYEIELNGKRVGDYWLTPGFTSYNENLQYQTYDVTDMLRRENTIEVTLAKGWCRGRLGWRGGVNVFDALPGILLMLRIEMPDGKIQLVPSDTSWKYNESAFLKSEIYDGETYDARKKIEESMNFDFDDSTWQNAILLDYPKKHINSQINEPVKIMHEIKPVSIVKTPKGETVIDFGQNMVGWVAFKVCGKPGDRVCLSHAEILDKDGNFYTDNLRTAENKVEYILSGKGEEFYHPHFTFQGFRYVRIDEYPGEIKLDNFFGKVIYSSLKSTGSFECSNDDVNKLYQNILWGQRGNYVDIPTDCPQRDERLGWTGDAQVFIKTAAMNMNVALFFTKWLKDLAIDQKKLGGAVAGIVPGITKTRISAGWGDAATICPFEIYHAYADKRLLARQYDSMKQWVEYIKAQGDNPYHWEGGYHYGDWLGLDSPPGSNKGSTDDNYIADAYYAHSTSLVSRAAALLGHQRESAEYSHLNKGIVNRFKKTYLDKDGVPNQKTQTACALALFFNLTDNKKAVADALAEMIIKTGNHLTTGFIGTPYLLHALSDNGYEELAYTLFLRTEYPSWLFSVKQGATTIWEHWDGIRSDGTLWSETMNSFNHYAYGAVADWMYTKIAGINYSTDEPGYKKIFIKPILTKHLSYVFASVDSMYGRIESGWKSEGDSVVFNVMIPPNTSATLVYPDGTIEEFGSGKYIFTWNAGNTLG